MENQALTYLQEAQGDIKKAVKLAKSKHNTVTTEAWISAINIYTQEINIHSFDCWLEDREEAIVIKACSKEEAVVEAVKLFHAKDTEIFVETGDCIWISLTGTTLCEYLEIHVEYNPEYAIMERLEIKDVENTVTDKTAGTLGRL